jgi:hypothetical protein
MPQVQGWPSRSSVAPKKLLAIGRACEALALQTDYWFGSKGITVSGDFEQARGGLSWSRRFFNDDHPPMKGWWGSFFDCRKNTRDEH